MRLLRCVLCFAPIVLLACGGSASDSTTSGDAGGSRDGGNTADAGSRADGGSDDGGRSGHGGDGDAASGGRSGRDGAGTSGSGNTGGSASSGTAASSGSPTRACLSAGSYCTWSTADQCCSGSCDGDSCCGYLGDACENGFGCCEGHCIDGYCACPEGTLDCGNGCVDIEWNENRCGDCDTQCGVNSLCENSQCICDPNLFDAQFYTRCPDGCFNTRGDEQHCGDCTTVCTGGTECAGGTCECPFGTLDCGSGCEDITSNAQHCGACGNDCDAATENCVNQQCQCKLGLYACTPGVCVNRQTDRNNCGTCGLVCPGNKTCVGGNCVN